MDVSDAQHLLGLINGEVNDARMVRAAWARAVREAHPDTATCEYAESDEVAALQIRKLTKARDVLLNAIDGAGHACNLCRGTGKVRARLGTHPCGSCKGTGVKSP